MIGDERLVSFLEKEVLEALALAEKAELKLGLEIDATQQANTRRKVAEARVFTAEKALDEMSDAFQAAHADHLRAEARVKVLEAMCKEAAKVIVVKRFEHPSRDMLDRLAAAGRGEAINE